MISVPVLRHDPTDIVIESRLLGTLSVVPHQVYEFPDGLYGFPDAHLFALLPLERPGLSWLQSVEFSALTFLLVDPFMYVEGYVVDLAAAQLDDLQAANPSEILVLAILTLPRQPGEGATVNLQGPLAFNVVARRGKQVVVESEFGIRHPLNLATTSCPDRVKQPARHQCESQQKTQDQPSRAETVSRWDIMRRDEHASVPRSDQFTPELRSEA